jgi:hypothetical protein
MQPERSTMNTISGLGPSGSLNLGTRVTMRAFDFGIVGCVSSSPIGEERLGRTKKVLVKLSRVFAEASERVLQIEDIFR